jgi:ribosomal protein L37AE/L43A
MQLATYELKYCERCGSLRLRRAESAETYCEPCGQMLANFSLTNHAERASLLLRKPRAKSAVAPVMNHEAQAPLPFGRLQ